ncbi:MAG: DNA-binding protein [Candidatus Omnitrophica bacterium]|nr:DNA-binding protein [Candidatus Omnitrophota bacterium]
MRRLLVNRLIDYGLIIFLLNTCYAQSISSTELINHAELYDGKVVNYEGEVIGEIMRRGEYAWINLNDGKNAIGVWLPFVLSKDIVYTGNYRTKGDWILVTGIFHRACPEHGGDLDIHAQEIKKISSGGTLKERLNPAKRNLALGLLGVLILVWILRQLRQR